MMTSGTLIVAMKRRAKPRARTSECPYCPAERLFTPQGLSGHLQLQHQLTPEQIREVMADPPEPKHPKDVTWPIAAVIGVGVVVGGVALALRSRNLMGCTRCGTKLDVSEARAQGANLVRCPGCQAVVQLP